MKLSTVLLGVLAGVSTAHNAGSGQPMPKLMGARRFLAELKAINSRHLVAPYPHPEARVPAPAAVEERQNTDGQCGPGFGNCAAGICCSDAG